jgi:hypothetical protein
MLSRKRRRKRSGPAEIASDTPAATGNGLNQTSKVRMHRNRRAPEVDKLGASLRAESSILPPLASEWNRSVDEKVFRTRMMQSSGF